MLLEHVFQTLLDESTFTFLFLTSAQKFCKQIRSGFDLSDEFRDRCRADSEMASDITLQLLFDENRVDSLDFLVKGQVMLTDSSSETRWGNLFEYFLERQFLRLCSCAVVIKRMASLDLRDGLVYIALLAASLPDEVKGSRSLITA